MKGEYKFELMICCECLLSRKISLLQRPNMLVAQHGYGHPQCWNIACWPTYRILHAWIDSLCHFRLYTSLGALLKTTRYLTRIQCQVLGNWGDVLPMKYTCHNWCPVEVWTYRSHTVITHSIKHQYIPAFCSQKHWLLLLLFVVILECISGNAP